MLILPFGFSNASAIYQRHIEDLLRDQLFKNVVVFVDDMIGYGKSLEEFLQWLDYVLGAIKANGLKMSPDNCVFGESEISCLGFKAGKE